MNNQSGYDYTHFSRFYDEKKHLLTIEIRPPMDACIASADNKMIARQMNKTVEILVGPHPEQYVWV
ncbi:lipid A biosynthesis (KDO)2-(lauroyl)-lipid IVA acyltransferase [Escherichia coli]|uniref:Lipid A biosynthesis (KDO)2-(Lauroyl)-lipid IVA acyltransferase n=1 Tax=Escherichia coli TaxID=562 RepID=A0A376IYA5_ECOLX|nr:lipid A biosynthesis (KDO)2-(lauroyl)-lipid IVA acyltransferase [Escherichia coli]